jgi:hypothetical protein
MTCIHCRQPALFLFPGGICQLCRNAPDAPPPPKSSPPPKRIPSEFRGTIDPADLHACAHCFKTIEPPPGLFPSEYRKLVTCSPECRRAYQGTIQREAKIRREEKKAKLCGSRP